MKRIILILLTIGGILLLSLVLFLYLLVKSTLFTPLLQSLAEWKLKIRGEIGAISLMDGNRIVIDDLTSGESDEGSIMVRS